MADQDGKILTTIKAALGLQEDYDVFDIEVLLHINSVLSTLNQLGVGPRDGIIADAETAWSALLEEDKRLESVKSYVYLRVKLLFDSSGLSQHVVAAMQKMIEEAEWRITVTADPMIPQLVSSVNEDDEFVIEEDVDGVPYWNPGV